MSKIRPWNIKHSQPLNDYKIFRSRADRVVSPRTGKEHEVYVLENPVWVNVLALTPDRQVVLVEQYRHGTRTVMLEIPGGLVDAGEAPEAAGARELLEETGYAGKPVRILGTVDPNPAFQSNLCHTILIEDARPIKEPEMDGAEDIAVQVVPEEEFLQMITDGRITHSLVVVASLWLRLWRQGLLKPQG